MEVGRQVVLVEGVSIPVEVEAAEGVRSSPQEVPVEEVVGEAEVEVAAPFCRL